MALVLDSSTGDEKGVLAPSGLPTGLPTGLDAGAGVIGGLLFIEILIVPVRKPGILPPTSFTSLSLAEN